LTVAVVVVVMVVPQIMVTALAISVAIVPANNKECRGDNYLVNEKKLPVKLQLFDVKKPLPFQDAFLIRIFTHAF
jgi:hypothetical protein